MKTHKNLAPVVLQHDVEAEAAWTVQTEILSDELQEIVQIWQKLGFGPLQPGEFIELITDPEGVFARHKATYVKDVHKEEQKRAGRPLDIRHIEASVGISSADLMFAFQLISLRRPLALTITGLYRLNGGMVQLDREVAANYKDATFKKTLTDRGMIEEYHLTNEAADLLNRLSKLSEENSPRLRPLIFCDASVTEFRWFAHFQIDVQKQVMNVNKKRFFNSI